MNSTLTDWITREVIPFSLDEPAQFQAAVDRMIAGIGGKVEVLGLGEPMHGAGDFLVLRNRLFQRLVEAHGYTAIAMESSFPRGRMVNDYVAGRGGSTLDAVCEAGFSHGFGKVAANRSLVEWVRQYNAEPSHAVKLQFYGFDAPTEMSGADSPRRHLHFALDAFAVFDPAAAQTRRERIDALLGPDADWENSAAAFDPTKSIGLSPAANALRVETEELIGDLQLRRPEWIARIGADHFAAAAHDAASARQLLNYHAAMARPSADRIAVLLGIRDATMADHLLYLSACERPRGKVFAFAHNSHFKRGRAEWQWGPQTIAWWPAGAHLHALLGERYAVIGTGLVTAEGHGICAPEAGTLEARFAAPGEPMRFIPTHRGEGLDAGEIAALPVRSTRNPGYFPLNGQSFTDYDWLAVLDAVR